MEISQNSAITISQMHTIGIIGGTNGLGKRFATFFSKKFPEKKILVSGRNTPLSNEDLVRQSDLVIFSVPIGVTKEVILSLGYLARPEQIWTDFTSVKGFVMDTFAQIPDLNFCGLHPLFGPLKDIRNQKLVFCPGNLSEAKQVQIKTLLEDFEILETSPQSHDQIMGVVQCVSHFSDLVLGKSLQDLDISFAEILKYSSAPYRIKLSFLARIFAQNPLLYTDISRFNPYAQKFQESFLIAGKDWLKMLKQGDDKKLRETFLSIETFLGKNFCIDAWEKSQSILAQEADFSTNTLVNSECNKLSCISHSKTKNLENKWVIFGEKCSHTDEASNLFEGINQAEKIYRKNIFEVFDAVEEGKNIVGIVPYENSTQGSIFETLDELFDREKISIMGAQEMQIGQHLLVWLSTPMQDIEVIYSHPQALAQSQKFLRKFCPQARLEAMPSTSIAVQKVSEWKDHKKAAIGSKYAAKMWGLEALAENMEQEDNKTRFVKIVKKDTTNDEKFLSCMGKPPALKLSENFLGQVSFVVWFDRDKSGNLAYFLMFLSEQEINLTKLDSRRAGKEWGGYLFFFDAEATPENFMKILPDLKKLVAGVKVLGVF
jgi:prephenate dehydratase/prephenate dehydrogenase